MPSMEHLYRCIQSKSFFYKKKSNTELELFELSWSHDISGTRYISHIVITAKHNVGCKLSY